MNLITFHNGRKLSKFYDLDYAIDKVISTAADGLLIDATPDVLGNLKSASSAVGASPPTRSFQYDPLYRLTGVTDASSASLESYSYNRTGDRLSKTLAGQSTQTYSYGNPLTSHQLQSVAGVGRTYDQNGNTTGRGDNARYTYSDANRLAEVCQPLSCPATTATHYSYFYNGRVESHVAWAEESTPIKGGDMRKIWKRAASVLLIAATGSCANLDSIHHTFDAPSSVDAPTVRAVSVDVKQRFLEMSKRKVAGDNQSSWIACAEPSPDALTTFGASAGLTAQATLPKTEGNTEVAAQFANVFAEQAAAIGLRTQSITLLRDSAFRLCEGFMDGAIGSAEFQTLHRRLQNVLVATLAIEQLTGYARPTIVTVGAGGASSGGGALAQAQKELDAAVKDQKNKEDKAASAKKGADAAKTDADTAQASADKAKKDAQPIDDQAKADAKALDDAKKAMAALPATATDDQKKAAQLKVDDAQKKADASAAQAKDSDKKADDAAAGAEDKKNKQTKAEADAKTAQDAADEAKKNTDILTQARDTARDVSAEARPYNGQIQGPPASPVATKAVADAVRDVVQTVINKDYAKDMCLGYLLEPAANSSPDPRVRQLCVDILDVAVETQKQINKGKVVPSSSIPFN